MSGVNGSSRSLRSIAPFRFPFTPASFAWTLLAALGLLTAQLCTAQTAHYSGTLTSVGAGLNQALGVAVDRSGNVYIADSRNDRVLKETLSDGSYTQSVIDGNVSDPKGVAVDRSGNVYTTDAGNARVVKDTPSGDGYTQSTVVTTGQYTPYGVAVDASGNVYFSDEHSVLKEIPSGGTYTQSTVATGLVAWGVAVDGNGNVYIPDGLTDSVLKETPSGDSYTTSTVVSIDSAESVAVDSGGDVYVAATYNGVLKETPSGGAYTQSVVLAGLGDPFDVAVDASGNLYIADPSPPPSASFVLKLQVTGANLGLAHVASTNIGPEVVFTFDTGGTLNTATPYQVLTQGAPKLDFADAGRSSCSAGTTYTAGEFCFVNVSFTPKFAGSRCGAVNLYGSSGNVIATAYVYGTGVGPQITFPSRQQSIVIGSGLLDPAFLAADGSGNVYISDSGAGTVYKETLLDGNYTQSTVATGLSSPYGVAVDGGGNVYIAQDGYGDGNNSLLKETPSGTGYVESTVFSNLGTAGSVAVDGSGIVYVSNWIGEALLKIAPSGTGYTVSQYAIDECELDMAVDSRGNLYCSDPAYGMVFKETPAGDGYTQSLIASGLTRPFGLALDGRGDIYIADQTGNRVVKETPSDGSYTQSTVADQSAIGAINPFVVEVDGAGNLYVVGTTNSSVLKLDLANPPSLSFASTHAGGIDPGGPHTVTVANIGTAALTFPVPSSGNNPGISANFTLASGDDSDCPLVTAASSAPGMLPPGKFCLLPISFSPGESASGNISGTLTLTDDNRNAGSPAFATQTIPLTGIALVLRPFGSIDSVVDSVTMSTTVGSSDSVEVTGWVADEVDGAPLSNVKVYIDGTLAGTPTLGIARYGVAVDYKNPAYLDSGYQLLYSAASLSVGTHAVTVTAIDSLGNSRTFGPVSFTVAASAGASPPFGSIAYAEDSVTFSNTVGQSHSVDVRGWVADPVDGSPLSNVKVYIDGTLVTAPTLGIATPTVATKYNNAAYAHAGFELLYPATSLALGNHQVTVVAVDSGGRSITLGPVRFTVAATAGPGSPFGGIAFAGDSTTMTTTVSPSHSLEVEGWVADATDGSPLSNVGVYIDDVLAGTPTLGIASPSVAAMYGNPAYGHAKYQFLYPAASLAAGAHWVTVIAVDSGGRSTTFGPNIFTVQ